jgi:hypothetical protein
MHAPTLKLVQALLPRLDVPIVRVVYHNLSALDSEEVPYLVLDLALDPSA